MSEREQLLKRARPLMSASLLAYLQSAPMPELTQIVIDAEAQHVRRQEIRNLRTARG